MTCTGGQRAGCRALRSPQPACLQGHLTAQVYDRVLVTESIVGLTRYTQPHSTRTTTTNDPNQLAQRSAARSEGTGQHVVPPDLGPSPRPGPLDHAGSGQAQLTGPTPVPLAGRHPGLGGQTPRMPGATEPRGAAFSASSNLPASSSLPAT